MSVENGILNLTNWLGNVILPTLTGLFFAIAIVRFVGAGQHRHWIYAGLLSLMVSGNAASLWMELRSIHLFRGIHLTGPVRAGNSPGRFIGGDPGSAGACARERPDAGQRTRFRR